MEAELIEQYDQRRYVTGILATLDTRTGTLSWVNRGHHPPLIIRDGRWATHPQCPPAHPMGTGLGLESHVCREQLQPGDRVVLYTDGIVEAGGAGGPGSASSASPTSSSATTPTACPSPRPCAG